MMIKMGGGISLLIREPDREKQKFPSCRIQNGLVLFHGNIDLSEEGVGFGVPILKFGMRTIFPGSGCIESKKDVDKIRVKIDYDFNLAETIVFKGRRIEGRTLYKIKESLSWLHRKYPFSRKFLMQGSNAIRLFSLSYRYVFAFFDPTIISNIISFWSIKGRFWLRLSKFLFNNMGTPP
jgi:hypothetical protein